MTANHAMRSRRRRWLTAAASLSILSVTSSATATLASARPPAADERTTQDREEVHYRSVAVSSVKIFYREAGDPQKPTVLLLHGFPASSHEFRDLIPLLSSRFHVVAPDYPGFGFSAAPSAASFNPTFSHLTEVMSGFVHAVGLKHYIIYMQDFGGPVGLRLAVSDPTRVDGLIIQNANTYEVGVAPPVLSDMRARASGPLDAKGSAALEGMLSPEGTKFQYMTGVRDPTRIDPASLALDDRIQALPDHHRIQRALIVDYFDNVKSYPVWQAYLRRYRPKTLIIWGTGDPIFVPAGAEAYKADLPGAEVKWLDTGHFALEEDSGVIAQEIVRTFGRHD